MGRAKAFKIKPVTVPAVPLRLDLGCGPNPHEGFEGVDRLAFDGKVKHVVDLRKPWPWADGSVEEIHASHVIEHFTALERVHVMNEMYRVLKLDGKATVIVPHWGSCRAYGDYTHQWPPVSEFWFYYLSREWRATQAPHCDITNDPQGLACNFVATWGWSMRQDLAARNQEFQQFAFANYKEAIQDIVATLVKAV